MEAASGSEMLIEAQKTTMKFTTIFPCAEPSPAPARILLLAPHPDDETLAAGGLLHFAVDRGWAIKVVFITDGDNNPWPQRVLERRLFLGRTARPRLAARRRREALAALQILGVNAEHVEFWSYPDQGLSRYLMSDDGSLRQRLGDTVQAFRPTYLVAPSRHDLHPDHNAIGFLVSKTLDALSDPQPVRLHYVVHGSGAAVRARDYVALPVNADARAAKRAALLQHRSQLAVSRRRFMAYVERPEYFLRDDAAVADQAWSHVRANGALEISVPRRGMHAGARVHLLTANGAHCARRVVGAAWPFVAPPAAADCIVRAAAHDVRLAIGLNDAIDARWLKLDAPWRFLDGSGWLQVKPAPRPQVQRAHVCCVIPCYNVAAFCTAVVAEALHYADTVIAIDDGSTDGTRDILTRLGMQHPSLQVLVHPVNRGKGAALLSAFAYALEETPFDVLVTLDADAQHRASDMVDLVRALRDSGAALAIGVRDQFAAMPLRSRIGNEMMGSAIRRAFPAAPLDTQSGFRAHTRGFVAFLVEHLEGRRYETELQILAHALAQGPVASISIPTVYRDNNRSSHFQPLRDSLRVLAALGKFWFNELRPQRR